MKHHLKTGFSFGVTSGIITTLGLMVGLHSGTQSRLVVIGGVLTIAIADAFSDALGIHISEEAENCHTAVEIWESTITTFLTKFLCALTFIAPLLLFELSTAIIASVIWGIALIAVFSYYIARDQGKNPLFIVTEHLVITIIVLILTHYAGDWIGSTFC
jgi:VIT1/CCC1 family predicted Fe2+/Mn2+ transporter